MIRVAAAALAVGYILCMLWVLLHLLLTGIPNV